MIRRGSLLASFAAVVAFAACGPASHNNDDTPDADPALPDAGPPCDRTIDTDGDTIADCDDGAVDTDMDTVPNLSDTDSDGDGYTDAQEAGDADPQTLPQDSDGDGKPNFIDIDSDNDGLLDEDELSHGTDP